MLIKKYLLNKFKFIPILNFYVFTEFDKCSQKCYSTKELSLKIKEETKLRHELIDLSELINDDELVIIENLKSISYEKETDYKKLKCQLFSLDNFIMIYNKSIIITIN